MRQDFDHIDSTAQPQCPPEGETADAVCGHERDIAEAVLATTVAEGHGDMTHAEAGLGFSFSIKPVSSMTS
ncbi:hypothetical protein Pa4123_89360 [Phytohabitans aurantiacus]|uniref:Uncharacterized protein n=1 Tax=Phytohabitans aurantiacus TaxID=3016789 RepID=A0ABQ5RB67_9ACTN|nr:hypothetical protein Pa4123_89360 [Phytohabitans aurantiacus]